MCDAGIRHGLKEVHLPCQNFGLLGQKMSAAQESVFCTGKSGFFRVVSNGGEGRRRVPVLCGDAKCARHFATPVAKCRARGDVWLAVILVRFSHGCCCESEPRGSCGYRLTPPRQTVAGFLWTMEWRTLAA